MSSGSLTARAGPLGAIFVNQRETSHRMAAKPGTQSLQQTGQAAVCLQFTAEQIAAGCRLACRETGPQHQHRDRRGQYQSIETQTQQFGKCSAAGGRPAQADKQFRIAAIRVPEMATQCVRAHLCRFQALAEPGQQSLKSRPARRRRLSFQPAVPACRQNPPARHVSVAVPDCARKPDRVHAVLPDQTGVQNPVSAAARTLSQRLRTPICLNIFSVAAGQPRYSTGTGNSR